MPLAFNQNDVKGFHFEQILEKIKKKKENISLASKNARFVPSSETVQFIGALECLSLNSSVDVMLKNVKYTAGPTCIIMT